MSWANVATPVSSYSTVAPAAQVWGAIGLVSVETRYNHIYPETERNSHVPFIWRIQTQFPFFVTTGCKVYIRSQISEAFPAY